MKSIDGLCCRDDKNQKAKTVSVKSTTTTKKGVNPKSKKVVVVDVKEEEVIVPEKDTREQVAESFVEPVKSFDFDVSSEEIKDEVKEKTKMKPEKKKKKKHVFGWILGIIFILLAGSAGALMLYGNEIISKITGGKSGIFNAFSLMSENYVDLKTDDFGRTNILVFGTSGYNMAGDEGNGVHDGAQLTDSIMLVSIDQKTGDVAMTNLPRDLKAIKTCTATGKINEVYWCNNMRGDNEEGGAKALMEAVGTIFGVDFQYYAHINWNTLITIVDSIGGITVTLDEDVNDYYFTKTVISANTPTVLNGSQALGLARARHGTALGDFSRGNSQQKILIAIKDKIRENGLDLTQILNIVNSLGDNLRTNVSLDEIKTGAHILDKFDLAKLRQVPLIDWGNGIHYMKTANINNISYVIPYAGEGQYTQLQGYIRKMFSSDPTVYEGSDIEVLNGTGEPGVAANEKERLAGAKITVSSVSDAPEGDYPDVIIYMQNAEKYGTKTRLEDFYDRVVSTDPLPEGIVSDADFVVIIGKKPE